MKRVGRIPLDGVAEDDVIGVEIGTVVELHAITKRAGPGHEIRARLTPGREGGLDARAPDRVRVKRLVDLLAGPQRLAV